MDRAVVAVCDLQRQVNDAGTGQHQTRRALEAAMTDAMVNGKTADHTGLSSGMIEAQARLIGGTPAVGRGTVRGRNFVRCP